MTYERPPAPERACPGCGRRNASHLRFCLGCGADTSVARAFAEPPRAARRGATWSRSPWLWIALAAGVLGPLSAALIRWVVSSRVQGTLEGIKGVGGPPPGQDPGSSKPRDHMHLETDGVSKDVWMSGWASIPHPGHPELAFTGTLGCAGQRFKTNLTKHTRLDIGYTAHRAFVIVVEEPYVLAKPPIVEGKTLVWEGRFKSTDGGSTRWFRLRIDCPLPAK